MADDTIGLRQPRTRRGPTRPSPSRGRAGGRWAGPRACPTSTSGGDGQAADAVPASHRRGPRQGGDNTPNTVLHPWLQAELPGCWRRGPRGRRAGRERGRRARWATWLGREPRTTLPPLRLILVWDNLAGHLSWAIVRWLFQHGVMPLYTPLSGSWLNMAEAEQRIIAGRALAGSSRERSGGHRVVRGDGGRLERAADAVRLGRQAPGAARPRPPAGARGRPPPSPTTSYVRRDPLETV